jgi:hypothetical protein
MDDNRHIGVQEQLGYCVDVHDGGINEISEYRTTATTTPRMTTTTTLPYRRKLPTRLSASILLQR